MTLPHGQSEMEYGFSRNKNVFQPAITCSKLTIEILEQGLKYVQS